MPSPIAEQFRAARRDRGLAVLEGFHAVKHAFRFGAEIRLLVGADAAGVEVLVGALAPDLRARFADLELVSPEVFSRLAPQAPQTGVMAIARRPPVDVAQLLGDPAPGPIVLLEDPRRPANLGACVRVAAAADAGAVLTTGSNDPWQPEALRGSAGLHFALPVAQVPEAPIGDRPLIALDPDGEPLVATSLPARAVLAFGTERHGLSADLLAAAQRRVSIPMRAGVSSLNLATSVAAVLFGLRLSGQSSD